MRSKNGGVAAMYVGMVIKEHVLMGGRLLSGTFEGGSKLHLREAFSAPTRALGEAQLEGITYSLGDEFAASGPCGLWDMPLGGSHAGAWTWRTLPYIGVLRPPQGLFSAVGAVRLPHSSK